MSVIGSFGWGGRLTETLQTLLSNLNVEFLPAVLAKGLPRAKEYAALDALADAFKTRIVQPEPQPETPADTPQKYMCSVCRYIYDPAKGDPAGGIAPGTPFEKIPDDWVCPVCRVPKSMFRPISS